MATLITVRDSDGARRCDAKCYNATSPHCDCVCGGLNHGKGLAAAQANTAAHSHILLDQLKRDNPNLTAYIADLQEELFQPLII